MTMPAYALRNVLNFHAVQITIVFHSYVIDLLSSANIATVSQPAAGCGANWVSIAIHIIE